VCHNSPLLLAVSQSTVSNNRSEMKAESIQLHGYALALFITSCVMIILGIVTFVVSLVLSNILGEVEGLFMIVTASLGILGVLRSSRIFVLVYCVASGIVIVFGIATLIYSIAFVSIFIELLSILIVCWLGMATAAVAFFSSILFIKKRFYTRQC